jgi:hypothetical protein
MQQTWHNLADMECVLVRFSILLLALPALMFSQDNPQPGQLKVNPKDGLRYAWIPPGAFTMGCSPVSLQEYAEAFGKAYARPPFCDDDEYPPHNVTVIPDSYGGGRLTDSGCAEGQ